MRSARVWKLIKFNLLLDELIKNKIPIEGLPLMKGNQLFYGGNHQLSKQLMFNEIKHEDKLFSMIKSHFVSYGVTIQKLVQFDVSHALKRKFSCVVA